MTVPPGTPAAEGAAAGDVPDVTATPAQPPTVPSGSPLRDSAYRGGAAAAIQQGGRLFFQIASLVVLARLLTPEDFGVYAMVMPIAAVVSMFQGLGLTDVVIQRKDITSEQINTLYWVNFALSCGVALVLVMIAPLVAWAYGEPRTAALTAAWSIATLIGATAQQQYGLLARDLRFMTLAMLDLACVSIGFVVAVAFAWLYQSYWALWASTIASGLMWAIGSTAASKWRPSRPSFKADTDGMLKFGAHLTGVAFVDFFATSTDKALIGRFWGATTLGFYDRAYKLVLFPLQNVSTPMARIAIPLLSRLKDEPERLRSAYLRFVGQINMLAVPGIAIALAAPDALIGFALGEDWIPAARIFAWLGLAAVIQPMAASANWIFTVQARSGEMLRCSVVNGLIAVAAIVIGLQHGAVGVARALALAQCLICMPFVIFMVTRRPPMRVMDYVNALAPFALAAAVTWLLVRLLSSNGVDGLLLLVIAGFISYGSAFLAMLAFPAGRATLQETRTLAERLLGLVRKIVRR